MRQTKTLMRSFLQPSTSLSKLIAPSLMQYTSAPIPFRIELSGSIKISAMTQCRCPRSIVARSSTISPSPSLSLSWRCVGGAPAPAASVLDPDARLRSPPRRRCERNAYWSRISIRPVMTNAGTTCSATSTRKGEMRSMISPSGGFASDPYDARLSKNSTICTFARPGGSKRRMTVSRLTLGSISKYSWPTDLPRRCDTRSIWSNATAWLASVSLEVVSVASPSQ